MVRRRATLPPRAAGVVVDDDIAAGNDRQWCDRVHIGHDRRTPGQRPDQRGAAHDDDRGTGQRGIDRIGVERRATPRATFEVVDDGDGALGKAARAADVGANRGCNRPGHGLRVDGRGDEDAFRARGRNDAGARGQDGLDCIDGEERFEIFLVLDPHRDGQPGGCVPVRLRRGHHTAAEVGRTLGLEGRRFGTGEQIRQQLAQRLGRGAASDDRDERLRHRRISHRLRPSAVASAGSSRSTVARSFSLK